MEVEAKIKGFLMALGFDTAKTVKELTEGDAVAVYEGERDPENDALVMERYEHAEYGFELLLVQKLSQTGLTIFQQKLSLSCQTDCWKYQFILRNFLLVVVATERLRRS